MFCCHLSNVLLPSVECSAIYRMFCYYLSNVLLPSIERSAIYRMFCCHLSNVLLPSVECSVTIYWTFCHISNVLYPSIERSAIYIECSANMFIYRMYCKYNFQSGNVLLYNSLDDILRKYDNISLNPLFTVGYVFYTCLWINVDICDVILRLCYCRMHLNNLLSCWRNLQIKLNKLIVDIQKGINVFFHLLFGIRPVNQVCDHFPTSRISFWIGKYFVKVSFMSNPCTKFCPPISS